jgi:Ankyrin repeats (3 copies)
MVLSSGAPAANADDHGAASTVSLSRKRKLDAIAQQLPTPALAPLLPAVTPSSQQQHVGPADFVRCLFASTKYGQECLARPRRVKFRKPSPEEIDAYDMDAVKGVREGNVDKLRALWRVGKTMNAANRFGESLISMACRRGHIQVVRFLLWEAHVRLDIHDDYGRTPLHDACWTSMPNTKIMDELLQVCSPEMLLAEDVRGHTPFQYARREHWEEWETFLKIRSNAILDRLAAAAANATPTVSTDTISTEHTNGTGTILISG